MSSKIPDVIAWSCRAIIALQVFLVGTISLCLQAESLAAMSIPGREVSIHGLKLFLDMGVGIGGDKWPAADLVRNQSPYGLLLA